MRFMICSYQSRTTPEIIIEFDLFPFSQDQKITRNCEICPAVLRKRWYKEIGDQEKSQLDASGDNQRNSALFNIKQSLPSAAGFK